MANLHLNVDNEINLIVKYNLSPNELYVIRALLVAQNEPESDLFVQYMNIPESVRGSLRDLLYKLQEKGIILKSYKIPEKGMPFKIEDVEFNKNFTKNIYKASFDMGEELFDHYPQFANINGNMVGLRTVSDKYDSLEEAFEAYGRAIRWSPEIHSEIIQLLDWANEKGIINFKLAKFIIDRKWLDLKALKEGDSININFDTVKML